MLSLSRSIIMILPSKLARPIYVFKLRLTLFNQLLITKFVLLFFFFFAFKSMKKATARNVREVVLTLQAGYQRFAAALQRVQNYTILIYNTNLNIKSFLLRREACSKETFNREYSFKNR